MRILFIVMILGSLTACGPTWVKPGMPEAQMDAQRKVDVRACEQSVEEQYPMLMGNERNPVGADPFANSVETWELEEDRKAAFAQCMAAHGWEHK